MVDWKIIQLAEHLDTRRGAMYIAEFEKEIPFLIQRIYFMRDIPNGSTRGGQRHKYLEQILIPVSGSFDVRLECDNVNELIHVDKPSMGLYIAPRVKRTLCNFTTDAVCLVLASDKYDPIDIA